MASDVRSLVQRAHALHVEYVRLFDVNEIEEAEATYVTLDGVIERLEPLAADWPEAFDAIVDLCLAHALDARTDIGEADWPRLRLNREEANADVGLALGSLAHARTSTCSARRPYGSGRDGLAGCREIWRKASHATCAR